MSYAPLSARRRVIAALATLSLAVMAGLAAPAAAVAEERSVIDLKVREALDQLYSKVRGTRDLAASAKGILVMPEITKAGLIVGGSYGEGALLVNGQTVGYYSVAAASVGLQLGVQTTKQAIFFMTTDALERFRRADGWELGAGAEFTVPDDGLNASVTTTTAQKPVVSFVFGQDGFLAGASLAGAKYSKINR